MQEYSLPSAIFERMMKNALREAQIAVLGGSGHLGSALLHHLVNELEIPARQIRVFYYTGSPSASLADLKGLQLQEGDLMQPEDVRRACEGADVVFHLIGSTTFSPGLRKQQWLLNVEGTRNVLEALRLSGRPQRLVYVSTVNVLAPETGGGIGGGVEACSPYGRAKPLHSFGSDEEALAFAEKARTAGDDRWLKEIDVCYFDSKLAAQALVNDYAHRLGIDAVSCLPGTMFGPYDQLIGAGIYILSLYHGQMPAVTHAGLPLAHVCDVAEGLVLAAENGRAGRLYILSGRLEDNRTIQDMAAIICSELEAFFPGRAFPAPRLVLPYRLAYAFAWCYERVMALRGRNGALSTQAVMAGNHFWYFDSAQSCKELGYAPGRSFRQGVRDAIHYYAQHGLFEETERYIDKQG